MVDNFMCDYCKIASVCKAKTKLQAFDEEARVDLGVHIEMLSCDNYTATTEETTEEI